VHCRWHSDIHADWVTSEIHRSGSIASQWSLPVLTCHTKELCALLNPIDNRLYNRIDNRLYRVNKHPTGCQTGCQTGLTTGLTTVSNDQLFVQPVVKPGCTTGLTNTIDNRLNVCIHDTASCQTGLTTVLNEQLLSNRVVQPVWQWVWQPVVSCIQTFTRLSTRVNGALSIRSQWNLYLHLHLQQTDRHQSNGFFSRTTWAS